MKKKFTFLIAALMLLTMISQPTRLWGQTKADVLTYTLTPASGSNNSYAGSCDITISGITWNLTGNSQMQPWRIGGKNLSGVDRNLYSKTAISDNISKIEVTHGAANNVTVNSWTITVASDASFSNIVSTLTPTFEANKTTTINRPDGKVWSNCFYKFTYNVTIGGSNKFIEFTEAKFYIEGGNPIDPTITFNESSVYVGKTLDLSTLFTSNSSGVVTFEITAGGDCATLEGATLTGVAAGNVTVQASQAAAGNYNAGVATATITVPELISIAITTPPTKTSYDEGDTFDPTGMVVTATYNDSSTDDVTSKCTYTPSGALKISDTEIIVSYTENDITKTATQSITVNEYVQPTVFDISLNDGFFGTSYGGTASGITDENPVIGMLNHVSVTYAGSGNHYINNSQIRFYPSNKLTFEAPIGYTITKIVFTSAGTWGATISSNVGTYYPSTKTWEGEAASVLFTGSGTSRCDMSKATITLKAQKVLFSITVDVTEATTVFHVDDTFTHEGVVVTAHYDDASTAVVTDEATFTAPDMTTTGEKTITVSYIEDGVEKTTTYNITVNAAATLESITLSGDYQTVFTQYDPFSSEGIIVTAHYDDETTMNVTSDATFSGYDMLIIGDQTVIVSFNDKTATYGIIVNAYVQPTEITVNMNYEWLGSTNGGNLNSNQLPVVKEEDNIIITITDGTSTRPRGDADYIRIYTGSTLKFNSPTGYNLTKIKFITGGTDTWNAPAPSEGTLSDKIWSGNVTEVTFSLSGTCFIATIEITLERQKALSSISLSGEYPTTFPVDATFSHSGMIVTATYDDASTKDVTADATFTGYDMSTEGDQTVTVSYTENDVTKTTTYDISVIVPATLTSISLSGTYPTVFDKDDAFSSEGIVVTAHYDDETTMNVTSDATFSGYNMSTIGNQTVTVSYSDKTTTYNITILETGTESNPYTVAQALAVINALADNGTVDGKYVNGIISTVSSYSSNTITYWISDNGTSASPLQVYRGKGLDGANFTAQSDLTVGDKVVVYGQLKKYKSGQNITPEFNSNSSIKSYIHSTGANSATIAGTVVDFTIANNESYTVASNTTLTVTGTLTNNNPANLIIEDGGQLIVYDNGVRGEVQATVKKEIAAWSTNPVNGWYFIALPIVATDYNPSTAGLITDTYTGEDVSQRTYDLYKYVADHKVEEVSKPWVNYRAHTNDFVMANGQGYLYANASSQMLEFAGTVKPYSESNNKVTLAKTGWNLIGNPFTCKVSVDKAFNEVNNASSPTAKDENSIINPCEGIAVFGSEGDVVTFTIVTPSMSAAPNQGNLQMALAQTVATRGSESVETIDNAIVSFNEGSELPKFYFGTQNANIYIPMDNEEFAIVSSNGQGEMPVNFRAYVAGEYTITVNPEEVEMGYLHLIDNIAGKDVDLLANPSYTFNARTDDYESRFRLVFSTTMVNAEMGEDFAFMSDGQLVIANEGEATLQVIDVTGRVVATENINGTCSKAINAKAGVYVLRLINGTNVKTQKMVIR